MIKDNDIAIPMQSGGDVVAEGVSLDGNTDFLSRSTDLINNQDSKTFTFSCWVYNDDDTGYQVLAYGGNGTTYRYVFAKSNNIINFILKNSSDTIIVNISSDIVFPKSTWFNFMVSLDLADTNKRHIYMNDVAQSPTWSSYINDFICFTNTEHFVGSRYNSSPSLLKGRLSHLFIAREYIDLSITENRRLFITEDGKPA